MNALEMEMMIPNDGRLPSFFQQVFGRKARVIVLFDDSDYETDVHDMTTVHPTEELPEELPDELMALAGQIQSFRKIADPVAFQQRLRDEWDER